MVGVAVRREPNQSTPEERAALDLTDAVCATAADAFAEEETAGSPSWPPPRGR